MGGVPPETLRDRKSRTSPHGWVHDVSLGVHPPCRRDSDDTQLKESLRTSIHPRNIRSIHGSYRTSKADPLTTSNPAFAGPE